jgi:hypothetical protein
VEKLMKLFQGRPESVGKCSLIAIR